MSFLKTFKEIEHYNTNIQLALISGFFLSVGRGMVIGTIFSIFVKILSNSDEIVGFVATFGGMIMTIALFPSGFIADRTSRRHILRLGSIFIVIGFLVLIYATDVAFLFIGQGFISLSNGMTRPSLEALIADSLPTGNREKIYSQIYFVRQAANSAGPLLAIILFLIVGNNWSLNSLKAIILVGALFTVVGAFFQMLMNARYSLGHESENLEYQTANTKKDSNSIYTSQTNKNTSLSDNWRFVPTFLIILGFIIGLGAGMTIKFFPIFFTEIYILLPSTINAIYFISALATALAGLNVPKLAKYVGKIEAMFMVQIIAIICLFIIALIPPLIIVVPLYILRGGFMNASQPIQRSLLMDYVPKKNRGLWNSFEVLSSGFLWSISAGLGGILLNSFNYPVLFVTTACLYILGTIPLLWLRKYVGVGSAKKTLLVQNISTTTYQDVVVPGKEP